MTDAELLGQVLAHDERLDEREFDAFDDMRTALESGERAALTPKQSKWLHDVAERLEVITREPANLWSNGAVPAGAHVDTPAVLRNLPMKPPLRGAR